MASKQCAIALILLLGAAAYTLLRLVGVNQEYQESLCSRNIAWKCWTLKRNAHIAFIMQRFAKYPEHDKIWYLSLSHKFYTQTTNSFKHSPQPTYLPLSRLAPMKLYVLITVAHRFRLPLFIDTHLKNFETFVSRFHPSLISKMLIWIPNILAYAKIRTSSIWQRRQQQSPMQHPFVYRWNRPDQCNLRREDAEKKMDFVMYSKPLQGIQIESEPRPNSVWGSKVV